MLKDVTDPSDILSFWREAGFERWYAKDDAFDAEIRARFGPTHAAAASGALRAWEDSDDGALALVIVLDQFSRNLFRNDPRAFACDAMARGVADRAIAQGRDARAEYDLRTFFYLPFEHSEDSADQARSVALFGAHGDADGLKWARLHADIIAQFGRFPHRNPVLGRAMTPAERAYLEAEGFAG